ncbi:MAG: agmatinase [Candidatus Poseidoniia archaeon]|nr:agmatinase [Candidatus Poseidoniia archaeon]MDP7081756.1 agmatinase [Candidatus Poseidoniia archaeon]MDP7255366.1 agmatinase [Candidatus Poseidoniia archaeon]MDP7473359.1 agmatinase [Candidatus Poseidoniia archaeon]MDP7538176.1 agmatinase [Candidatus Poseidoniia archaeon]
MPEFFADAEAAFDDARFVIWGYPFDGTACFRKGAADGPEAIRHHSHNFESWLNELGLDLRDVPTHDWGDVETVADQEANNSAIGEIVDRIGAAGKFSVGLGGEHSLTPPAVAALKQYYPNLTVVVLDAHLDYRDGYQGAKWSHAATTRRVSEIVGVECVRVIGVRSLSREEQQAAREDDLSYIEAGWVDLREHLSDIVDALDGPLYLSLDMDAIDPAFAPGVGTPEPFGMTPYEVLQVLNFLSDRLVGFDCVETCPPADNGNTAALAARLVRHALGAVVKAQTAGE